MYQGYFINLAQNETRRAALLEHLTQIGAVDRYQRVEAVDGREVIERYPTRLDPGNLGLWLTHVEVLKAAEGTEQEGADAIEAIVNIVVPYLRNLDANGWKRGGWLSGIHE